MPPRRSRRVSFNRGRLLDALRASRLSQKEVARRTKFSQQRINYLFKKARTIDVRVLRSVTRVLNVPAGYLRDLRDDFPRARKGQPRVKRLFLLECYQRYCHDIRWCGPKEADDRRAAAGDFMYAINALLEPTNWWNLYLRPRRPGDEDSSDYWHIIAGDDPDLPDPHEMDQRTVEALISAFELLFKPWFDRVARIDYQRVIASAFEMFQAGPDSRP